MLKRLAYWTSSLRGATITVLLWIIVILALSLFAPSSKEYAVNTGEGHILDNNAAAKAQEMKEKYFKGDDGLPGLLVLHADHSISEAGSQELEAILQLSEWLASDQKPEQLDSVLPFHLFPNHVQAQMFSEDQTTLILNFTLKPDIESSEADEAFGIIREKLARMDTGGLQLDITGPAGMMADTIALFKNADMVLLFATVGLILVLLILIYRSPLLAFIPLLIAGMVYMVVDRLLGLAGQLELFVIENQALSIMMILLFAVLTDYCLFVIARYREELRKIDSKHTAMRIAMTSVGEPIFFSGVTVLIAVLTLLLAVFKPYHHFAPVFAVAMFVIIIGGLTLIPAMFVLTGRKVFWPIIPKLQEQEAKPKGNYWSKLGHFVTYRPKFVAGTLLLLLVVSSLNVTQIQTSFNLLKSFPEEISSRQGFERLESKFPPGKLAPVHVVLASDKPMSFDEDYVDQLIEFNDRLSAYEGIDSVEPKLTKEQFASVESYPRGFVAHNGEAVQFTITLAMNPYDQQALDVVEKLRTEAPQVMSLSGLDLLKHDLYISGQTAEQVDVRQMNTRDIVIVFSIIAILITIMLWIQARSISTALVMIGTIILSYAATLGLGWLIFKNFLGYEAISYRLPMYTFVFSVALGVDYNIMLVSRIREEAKQFDWKTAISRGVSLTGGVISSAGLILAATFSVLMTQPLQELFLFGMTMGIGVLIDTFLVRGMLLPAILTFFSRSKEVKQTGQASIQHNS